MVLLYNQLTIAYNRNKLLVITNSESNYNIKKKKTHKYDTNALLPNSFQTCATYLYRTVKLYISL